MNVLISKKDAVRIAGSEEELRRMVQFCRHTHAEIHMVPTGAKLYITMRGAVRRYGIYGYRDDGSDVQEILDALKNGNDAKLRYSFSS
ncbi:MAG: hypothetical protein G01um101448_1144 [Parcubacteria group bacterium Gr01-1014_48]|nr:MAG: hypothetical protein G01um101448_1144 [Parcubacteria group bacterium Gr01-1014_48]